MRCCTGQVGFGYDMGATREAIQDSSANTKQALEAAEAAVAEVEKRMQNPLRHLDSYSQVREQSTHHVMTHQVLHALPLAFLLHWSGTIGRL